MQDELISRQAVLDITWEEPSYTDALNILTEVRDKVKALPSVKPQERTGHWKKYSSNWMCDQCNRLVSERSDYCPNCGAKMVEPQEVRDKG